MLILRGVSSMAKLPVSKTGLGGSNPSAPARNAWEWREGEIGGPLGSPRRNESRKQDHGKGSNHHA